MSLAASEFDEILQGAIRTAEVKGINFVIVRDAASNTQYISPLPTFECSPKDHCDLAAYTSETICHLCKKPLYSNDGFKEIKTRTDVEVVLADLESRLEQDLSAEQRSDALATKAAYLGSLGNGVEMLEIAQQAYDLYPSPVAARTLSEALFLNGRAIENEPLLREVVNSASVVWLDRLHYANSLRYRGQVHEAAAIERQYHCAPARYLPYWTGGPAERLHIFIDDGFGDAIYELRYLDLIKARGVKEIVVCVPSQYGEDFAALLRVQPWMPRVVMCPKNFSKLRGQITCAISAGDIDCTLDLDLSDNPRQPVWTANHESKKKYSHLRNGKPLIGICWSARQLNQPWVSGGAMRSLSQSQIEKIVREVEGVQWVSLQYKQASPMPEVLSPAIDSWRDTAGLIANLRCSRVCRYCCHAPCRRNAKANICLIFRSIRLADSLPGYFLSKRQSLSESTLWF